MRDTFTSERFAALLIDAMFCSLADALGAASRYEEALVARLAAVLKERR